MTILSSQILRKETAALSGQECTSRVKFTDFLFGVSVVEKHVNCPLLYSSRNIKSFDSKAALLHKAEVL